MFLLYVDESGDTGPVIKSPTRYYALSGLILHELRWQPALEHLLAYRKKMRQAFGLKLREEIHASAMLTKPGQLVRIKRNDRLTILRAHADAIATVPDISVVNVIVDKQGKAEEYDVFGVAWRVLLHRVHDTITHANFPGPRNVDDKLTVFPDGFEISRLGGIVRMMRRYNPVPNKSSDPLGLGFRNVPLSSLIEDPNYRNSSQSYFIQAADTCAWMLYQHFAPSAYVKKKAAQNYFSRLDPVVCRRVAPRDAEGIVRL